MQRRIAVCYRAAVGGVVGKYHSHGKAVITDTLLM